MADLQTVFHSWRAGRRFKVGLAGGLALGVALVPTGALVGARGSHAQTPSPWTPVVSAVAPRDVDLSAGEADPALAFDAYSWRMFIALVWPAAPGQRGAPDRTRGLDDSGPRVFESYKADWEVFRPGGEAPTPWNAGPEANPCPSVRPEPGDFVLASFVRGGDLGQAAFGNLIGPLVAQNGHYVRYLTSFGQAGFDQILSKQLYIRKNIDKAVFPVGSINVKSAWVETDGLAGKETFYRRLAWVKDSDSGQCDKREVALVGLHIVQKTAHRPQWIWSSFEHVSNVPEISGASTGPYTFNDGAGRRLPVENPIPFPPPKTPPAPFNVTRYYDLAPQTKTTNAAWRTLLKQSGSVWANYQLVVTQFPATPDAPEKDGMAINTYPGLANNTAVANTAMETFFQSGALTGCMACHNLARRDTDFVWSLQTHAFPRLDPAAPSRLAGW